MQGIQLDFTDWYHGHWRRVVATLTLVVGDAEVAEDATAEAFTRALASWPAVSRYTDPTAWVYRVALNEVRSPWRRGRHERAALARLAACPTALGAPPEPPNTALWSAVKDLPERMRTAVALRYVADMPEAEIAEAMRITRGTVASTLHDARRRLATTLEAGDSQLVVKDLR